MMGKLIAGEIKKIMRPKALITVAVLFLIFFIIFAIFYNINWDSLLETVPSQIGDEDLSGYIEIINGDISFLKDVTSENVDQKIAYYEDLYNSSINQQDGMDYYYKGVVSILDFVKANDLYGQNLNLAGYGGMNASAENFALSYFSTVLGILIIFAVVAMVSLYADEYQKGTIKLIMLRPVTVNQVTIAKIIAMFTVLLALLGITTLIGFLYGLAAFGSISMTNTIVLFNARTVWQMTYGGYVFLVMLLGTFSLFSYGILAFALGTILKKKTPAILIGLVVLLGIISGLLSFIGIDRFMFSNVNDLSQFLGINYSLPYKANFFIAMPMLIVYNAIMYFSVFFVTNKRDIV
ncbi:MAG TPA: ABC transporter permease subunit [Clostridia bacterium]|nr:ABC transporter permease subunit [Clostridia bacterium]